MPALARPDGVEIHWEERGEGGLVVLIATLLPEARVEQLAEGRVSRPDVAAAIVRRIAAT